MSDEKLGIAKQVMSHLGIEPEQLPEYMFDDKTKRTPLTNLDERILSHYDEESLWTMKTVRFLKDFSRFNAGVHLETNNATFLRTAELFRNMGIKNYYFLLQINNPLLKDVNPWDPDLTDEQKLMVLQEAQENVWYIVRELIKIDGRRFRANRAVISFIWSCLNHLPTLILMPRQSGKDQDGETEVLRPDGKWTKIKDLKVGDEVLARDGTIANITGFYPQGEQVSYEIEFIDGRKTKAGSEHLWTMWDPKKKGWVVRDTEHIKERLDKNEEGLSIPLPLEDRVTKNKDYVLHPYIQGVLFTAGDKSGLTFKTEKNGVVARVKKLLTRGWIVTSNGDQHTISMRTDYDPTVHRNVKQAMRDFGIADVSPKDRAVPKEIMEGSHHDRKMFIRGIMDVDGHIERGGSVYYASAGEKPSETVQRLFWSIGAICKVTKRGYKVNGDEPGERITRYSYRLRVRYTEPGELFLVDDRTLLVSARAMQYNSKLSFKSITKEKKLKQSYCIELDHPENLYITDNWIVTHNTVGMQVMAFIMQYLIGRGFKAGLITLAASNRMQFVNAMKKIRAGLPEYLVNVTYKDNDAGNILTYQAYGAENKNTFEVRVPSGGEDGAENVSRGSTFEMLLYDEPAWMKYIENIMNGAGPSTLTAQKNAREKGIPYFTAKATTPNSILKEEGKYMYGEMKKATEWRENFFDSYSESHLLQRVTKASPVSTTQPHICMQFNHLQLGFGKDWVKETMDKLSLSWSKAKIDLLMMWTEEGKNKVFDDKVREQLANVKQEPLWNEEIANTGLFIDWYYSNERLNEFFTDPTEFFLMGMDTSDAVDRDACTLIIRRMKTGENIGIGRYPRAFLDDVTTVLREMIVRIENSLLIIERNRAVDMIDKLLLTLPALDIDPFKRIFNDVYQDPVKFRNEWKDVQEVHFKYRTKEFYLKYKERFGFRTGPSTRRQMYDFLHEAVNSTGAGLRHPMLADELIGLETDSDGRIDHSKKGNDDLVIAWLLTFWFIKLGYNKSLYGIPPGQTLIQLTTLVNDPDKEGFTKDQLELFIRIKDRIEELSKELEDTDNDIVARRIELEIRKLGEYIPRELRKTITIDEILSNASKERNKRGLDKRFGRV